MSSLSIGTPLSRNDLCLHLSAAPVILPPLHRNFPVVPTMAPRHEDFPVFPRAPLPLRAPLRVNPPLQILNSRFARQLQASDIIPGQLPNIPPRPLEEVIFPSMQNRAQYLRFEGVRFEADGISGRGIVRLMTSRDGIEILCGHEEGNFSKDVLQGNGLKISYETKRIEMGNFENGIITSGIRIVAGECLAGTFDSEGRPKLVRKYDRVKDLILLHEFSPDLNALFRKCQQLAPQLIISEWDEMDDREKEEILIERNPAEQEQYERLYRSPSNLIRIQNFFLRLFYG